MSDGEMSERLKEHDWKSCVLAKLAPRVQIPLSPPLQRAVEYITDLAGSSVSEG
jgi:hypothetical protein